MHTKNREKVAFLTFSELGLVSKERSKISKGVMFLIIAILVIFTEVCGNPLFVTWKHAQVFIYDKPKFYEMKRSYREVL